MIKFEELARDITIEMECNWVFTLSNLRTYDMGFNISMPLYSLVKFRKKRHNDPDEKVAYNEYIKVIQHFCKDNECCLFHPNTYKPDKTLRDLELANGFRLIKGGTLYIPKDIE